MDNSFAPLRLCVKIPTQTIIPLRPKILPSLRLCVTPHANRAAPKTPTPPLRPLRPCALALKPLGKHTPAHITHAPAHRVTICPIMKSIALPLAALPLLLVACLEFTPNISNDFSEIEARAVFEAEARQLCAHKKARIPAILDAIAEAQATPTIDHWIFAVADLEAQVFPSGLITGTYHRHIQEALCRP